MRQTDTTHRVTGSTGVVSRTTIHLQSLERTGTGAQRAVRTFLEVSLQMHCTSQTATSATYTTRAGFTLNLQRMPSLTPKCCSPFAEREPCTCWWQILSLPHSFHLDNKHSVKVMHSTFVDGILILQNYFNNSVRMRWQWTNTHKFCRKDHCTTWSIWIPVTQWFTSWRFFCKLGHHAKRKYQNNGMIGKVYLFKCNKCCQTKHCYETKEKQQLQDVAHNRKPSDKQRCKQYPLQANFAFVWV